MFFTGGYAIEIRKILDTAMVSGQNVLFIGAPGWGKTDISQSYMEQMTGGNYCFVRIEQSTDPIILKGAIDPNAYFNGGGLVKMVAGTPYEPGIEATILDEAGRGNNPVFDIVLDIADRRDIPKSDRHPVIITTNFMPTDERTRALRDRFSVWYHLPEPATVDTDAILAAQAVAGGPVTDMAGSPTLDDAKRFRAMTPTDKALTAVQKVIRELQQAAVKEGFKLNPRRVTQWFKILFHVSAWQYNSNDFADVHPMALEMLAYAWPTTTPDEASRFSTFVHGTVNKGKMAAERCKARIHKALKKVVSADTGVRISVLQQAMVEVQQAQEELRLLLGADDPEFVRISEQTTTWTANAMQGKPIE